MFPDTKFAIISGLSILIFSTLIILTRPAIEKRRTLDLIAYLWLLAMLRPLLQPWIVNAGLISYVPRFLLLPALPLVYGPLFYLYIRKLTRPDKDFRVAEWLPALLLFLVILFFPYFRRPPAFHGAPAQGGFLPMALIDPGLTLIYGTLIFLLLKKHKRRVAEKLSQINEMKSLGSAYILLAIFVSLNLLLAIHRTTFHHWGLPPSVNQEIHGSGFLVMIISFSLFLARQRPVYSDSPDPDPEDVGPEQKESDSLFFEAKEDSGGMSANEEGGEEAPPDSEVKEIRQAIERQRLYMDSELTLESLARLLGRSRHQVSYLLNRGVNQNFYRYINGLRVEHASELLLDSEYAAWPVLRIALESGFSSKATFNRLFKEYKGKTAMEWRKKAS